MMSSPDCRRPFSTPAQERPPAMQRMLITAGVLIALVGLLWPWVSKLPFTTMIVVSLVLSLLVWLLRR
jgi:hypothetical protein